MDDFDKQISKLVKSDDDPKTTEKEDFSEIDKMLEKLRGKGQAAQKSEEQSQKKISAMMEDIDQEFDEIDSLLRDIDTLKIN